MLEIICSWRWPVASQKVISKNQVDYSVLQGYLNKFKKLYNTWGVYSSIDSNVNYCVLYHRQ